MHTPDETDRTLNANKHNNLCKAMGPLREGSRGIMPAAEDFASTSVRCAVNEFTREDYDRYLEELWIAEGNPNW